MGSQERQYMQSFHTDIMTWMNALYRHINQQLHVRNVRSVKLLYKSGKL